MIGSAVPDWAEIIKAAGSGPWSILALICLILAFLGNTFFVKAAPGVKILIFVLLLLAAVVGVGVYVSATALKGQLKEAKEKQEAAEKKAAELEQQLNDSKMDSWTLSGSIKEPPGEPIDWSWSNVSIAPAGFTFKVSEHGNFTVTVPVEHGKSIEEVYGTLYITDRAGSGQARVRDGHIEKGTHVVDFNPLEVVLYTQKKEVR
jgi:hypothetical protein